jgi:DNA polymerase III epsilon subunit-like protein
MPKTETYISIDVETSGPNPGNYSLLAIGACLVYQPERHFYVELQPVTLNFTAEALEISQLDPEKLRHTGAPPQVAMQQFAEWVANVTPKKSQPVFVAFNAPFDWMFINDYFHRYLGQNPFGHKALDIKSFYMGMTGVSFGETGMRHISDCYPALSPLSHHALQDAQDQARIFQKLMNTAQKGKY